MEDPSCEMCLSKDKTLQDLVYDLSTSGSGSGIARGRDVTEENSQLELPLWALGCHSFATASEPVQGVCHECV